MFEHFPLTVKTEYTELKKLYNFFKEIIMSFQRGGRIYTVIIIIF